MIFYILNISRTQYSMILISILYFILGEFYDLKNPLLLDI